MKTGISLNIYPPIWWGITAFTAATPRAYEIAGLYRSKGIPVVMGGIHASMCPDEAINYVDSIVIGEAESIWPKVIQDAEKNNLQKIYKGEYRELTGMPVPRRDLFNKEYIFSTVQTARGCPMDCEFCSVTAFNGQRFRRRPAQEVLAELESINNKMIFFVDDNIIGYGKKSREIAISIFQGMVQRKMNKLWFCQVSLNFADDEVLLWARKAGCQMVFIGLEAENIDSLKEINKKLNLIKGIDGYTDAFKRSIGPV